MSLLWVFNIDKHPLIFTCTLFIYEYMYPSQFFFLSFFITHWYHNNIALSRFFFRIILLLLFLFAILGVRWYARSIKIDGWVICISKETWNTFCWRSCEWVYRQKLFNQQINLCCCYVVVLVVAGCCCCILFVMFYKSLGITTYISFVMFLFSILVDCKQE